MNDVAVRTMRLDDSVSMSIDSGQLRQNRYDHEFIEPDCITAHIRTYVSIQKQHCHW